MTALDRFAVVAAFFLIAAICLGMAGRKRVTITEARSEADARVIGDVSIAHAEWPSDSLSREYGNEYEPRGM